MLEFFKMEGIGNDYVFIDNLDEQKNLQAIQNRGFIQQLCNRNTGIGSDGLVIIQKAKNPEHAALMQMWNADGSSSDMCGNALRCIALHVFFKRQIREFVLESGTGNHQCKIIDINQNENSAIIQINMGQPVFLPELIPFISETGQPLLEVQLEVNPRESYPATILSMGNPHCVIFVEDADKVNLERIGPLLENHPLFPKKTNVEFVSLNIDGTFYLRTFERGSGETLACGSGACAVAVAGVLTKKGGSSQKIKLRGGELNLQWSGSLEKNADVFMTGEARLVFLGQYLCN